MALRIDAPKKPPKKVSVERNHQGFITSQTIEEGESVAEPMTVTGVLPVRNVGPVQSVPTRTLRVVTRLDGEPYGDPQMATRPAGWSATDVLDDLKRAATTIGDDGVAEWGIPGAKRLLMRVTSDTPDRLELLVNAFTNDDQADAFQENEQVLREMALRDAETRRLHADRRDSAYRDLERRMDDKMAELRRLGQEAEDLDREFAREWRKLKADFELRKDERSAELFGRARQVQREHSALCAQMRNLSGVN
jgi:hypothetical protein